MLGEPSTTQSTLLALGFTLAEDSALVAPSDAVVTLTPTYDFVELRIGLANGSAVTAVLHKSALKICCAGTKL